MSIDSPVQVTFSDQFESDVRRLGKRYRRIRLDIQPLIERLELGELLGARIPGMEYTVFKVRVRNSSVQRGKSGGYRVIYYLKAHDQILFITCVLNLINPISLPLKFERFLLMLKPS